MSEQLNQVSQTDDEDSVSLSRLRDMKSSNKGTERQQRNRKELESEKMTVEKKEKFEWTPEECAQPIGKVIRITGKGKSKKCHYEKFQFHGLQYGLEETVLLVSEDAYKKPHAAMIKDIYVQGKKGYVMLEVQWFYRPEDVDKKSLENWKSKGPRELFYSFHRDEVYAESVKHRCIVHFVPENKEIWNRREHPGFIVQRMYHNAKKKLEQFNSNEFNEEQQKEIDFLVAKTIARVGDLSDIKKDQTTLTSKSKRLVRRSASAEGERMSAKSSIVEETDAI